MAFFAVRYTYIDDIAQLDDVRSDHRYYLSGLADQGHLRASGPLLNTYPAGALLIFEADTIDEVVSWVASDPFQQHRLVAEHTIDEWNPVIGDYARKPN